MGDRHTGRFWRIDSSSLVSRFGASRKGWLVVRHFGVVSGWLVLPVSGMIAYPFRKTVKLRKWLMVNCLYTTHLKSWCVIRCLQLCPGKDFQLTRPKVKLQLPHKRVFAAG